jgi:hypothetical protein
MLLQELDLSGNSWNFGLAGKCPNLLYLNISRYELRLEDVKEIPLCSLLKEIECDSTRFDFPTFALLLTKCPNLQVLNISNTSTLVGFEDTLLPSLPHLRSLKTYRAKFSSLDLQILLSKCHNLETLEITNCAARNLLLDMPPLLRLTHLDISYSSFQTRDLIELFSKCPNLEQLVIEGSLKSFMQVPPLPKLKILITTTEELCLYNEELDLKYHSKLNLFTRDNE